MSNTTKHFFILLFILSSINPVHSLRRVLDEEVNGYTFHIDIKEETDSNDQATFLKRWPYVSTKGKMDEAAATDEEQQGDAGGGSGEVEHINWEMSIDELYE